MPYLYVSNQSNSTKRATLLMTSCQVNRHIAVMRHAAAAVPFIRVVSMHTDR